MGVVVMIIVDVIVGGYCTVLFMDAVVQDEK